MDTDEGTTSTSTDGSTSTRATSPRRRMVSREDILTVARDHTVRHGWKRSRVQDIAADAGISRPTLYKEFPSKRELGSALVHWEVSKFIDELSEAVGAAPAGVRANLVAGIRFALEESEQDPFLAAVLTMDRDEESLLPEIVQSGAVLPRIIEVATALLAAQATEPDQKRLEFIAGAAVRLTVSYLVDPSAEPHALTAQRIADMCVTYLEGH